MWIMNHEIKFIKTRIIISNGKFIGVFGRNSFRKAIGPGNSMYYFMDIL